MTLLVCALVALALVGGGALGYLFGAKVKAKGEAVEQKLAETLSVLKK